MFLRGCLQYLEIGTKNGDDVYQGSIDFAQ